MTRAGAGAACVNSIFERYITMWGLTPDGIPIVTRSSRLFPVRKNGVPAMLKIAIAICLCCGGMGKERHQS
jgi:hypothetical protein